VWWYNTFYSSYFLELADNFIATDELIMSTGKQVAFVGRLSHEKGPDIYLRLARCFPEEPFHIYGSGLLEEELQRDAPDNVYFHGQQNDMSSVWQDIGLLVMPSRFEGLPMAALEAMGRGIPVMAFNVGALSSLISHNHNGWIIEPVKLTELSYQFQGWLEMDKSKQDYFKVEARQTILNRFSADVAIPPLIRSYKQLANI